MFVRSKNNSKDRPSPKGNFFAPPIQAKLTIGEPGDQYEKEADTVAEEMTGQSTAAAGIMTEQKEEERIDRAVAADYSTIRDNLTYGLFDWVIRDAEAREVLEILEPLNNTDLEDTVRQMESEGLVSRLMENISDTDRTNYASLIESINNLRSAGSVSRHIENLMSYGLLDWVITDAEARLAMETLKNLRSSPEHLRDVITAIPRRQYERFFRNLSEEDRQANLRFIQEIEMIRNTGMTLEEMGEEQRRFLEAEATAAGVSIGEFIRGETASRGYGGETPTWWPSLTPAEQADWTRRFNDAIDEIRDSAPAEILQLIDSAENAGGGIRFLPEDVESLGSDTLAFRRGNTLGVGKTWVEAVERDPELVFANIAHELGGHLQFGTPLTWEIMQEVLNNIPASERTIAESGRRSVYSAYAYMETEIYAELREEVFRISGSSGDLPETDIRERLEILRDAYSPTISEAVVRGFRRRVQLDSQLNDAARDLYDRLASDVFNITF